MIDAQDRRTLASIVGNVDQMQLIMGAVREYLDTIGLTHVPLNVAAIDRLALDCHALADKMQARGNQNSANQAA